MLTVKLFDPLEQLTLQTEIVHQSYQYSMITTIKWALLEQRAYVKRKVLSKLECTFCYVCKLMFHTIFCSHHSGNAAKGFFKAHPVTGSFICKEDLFKLWVGKFSEASDIQQECWKVCFCAGLSVICKDFQADTVVTEYISKKKSSVTTSDDEAFLLLILLEHYEELELQGKAKEALESLGSESQGSEVVESEVMESESLGSEST